MTEVGNILIFNVWQIITVEGKETHKPKYDLSLVNMIVGINGLPLDENTMEKYPENIHNPEDVW